MPRTKKLTIKYKKALKEVPENYRFENEEVIFDEFGYKVVKNSFPYDLVCDRHDIFFSDTNMESGQKLVTKAYGFAVANGYDAILLNMPKKKSLPKLNHVHLINWKNSKDIEGIKDDGELFSVE